MKNLDERLNEINFEELKETLCKILNGRIDYALTHRKMFEDLSEELSDNKDRDFSQYGLMSACVGSAALMLLRTKTMELELDDQIRLNGVCEFFKNLAQTICVLYGMDEDYVDEYSTLLGHQIYAHFKEENVDEYLRLINEEKKRN